MAKGKAEPLIDRFSNANVLMTGDYFRSIGYPNIDRNNGGSLKGMIEALNTTIQNAGPDTKIIKPA